VREAQGRLLQLVVAQFPCAGVLIAVVWADRLVWGAQPGLKDIALVLAWAAPFFAAGTTVLMHYAEGKPVTWLWIRASLLLPSTAAGLCVIDWANHDLGLGAGF
jgi:hypothetical protein